MLRSLVIFAALPFIMGVTMMPKFQKESSIQNNYPLSSCNDDPSLDTIFYYVYSDMPMINGYCVPNFGVNYAIYVFTHIFDYYFTDVQWYSSSRTCTINGTIENCTDWETKETNVTLTPNTTEESIECVKFPVDFEKRIWCGTVEKKSNCIELKYNTTNSIEIPEKEDSNPEPKRTSYEYV